jgi:hypothetical protein
VEVLELYPREKAIDVICHFRDYMASATDELTAYAALLHGPDGSPLVGVIPCYCGDVVEGSESCNLCASSVARLLMVSRPCPFQ